MLDTLSMKLAIKNYIPSTDPTFVHGPNHYRLYHAAEDGNPEEFFKYADTCTWVDAEWCAEVVSDVQIAKWLVQEKKVEKGWFKHALRRAKNLGLKQVENVLGQWSV
jgi:hypothetical protein